MKAGDVHNMRESLKEYCVRYDRRELLAQWHPNKNGNLTPAEITSGSQRKIWWRCDQGHEWESMPYERANGGLAVPIARENEFCRGWIWRRCIPIWLTNGIREKTVR